MLDGRPLIDAHQHPVRLSTVKPAWRDWAQRFGQPGWRDTYAADGTIIPQAFDDLMEAEGVDHSLLICEYSPKATGMQPAEDMLPIIKHNPARFSLLANVNPHLHYPVADEVARQAGLGAIGLKVHPVHGGFSPADPALYPAYGFCAAEGLPVVVHCGTSSFPGSSNDMADPALLIPVLRDFPGLTVVLAHGGRGWWYDAAASLALLHENVWIELSGLPPHRLPRYYARFDLRRLARKFIFGTDWPGVPGIARNARALAALDLGDDALAGVLAGNALTVYRRIADALHTTGDLCFTPWQVPHPGSDAVPVYALDDLIPVIDPDAYVHPDAVVIGAVELGAGASVWPGAVLRGDHGFIKVGERTSVQDGTIVHTTHDWPTVIGANCVVGHGAHLEGCVVEDACLIGSGSLVLNRAKVETGAVVAAAALVREDMVVPAGALALGVPATIREDAGLRQRDWIARAVKSYVETASQHRIGTRRLHLL